MKRKGRKRQIYALLRLNLRVLAAVTAALALCAAAVITVAAVTMGEGVEIPVVMYHSVLKDTSRHGKYVISPKEFEEDLQYLKSHGYTTILMEELIGYTQGGSLPERPILLTFDDGYYNNYLYAYEIAKRYESKFVISPIGIYSDQYTETPDENAYYSHATWEELREMASSGLVEVQNHSYDLHKSQGGVLGVKKASGERSEQYENRLKEDLNKASLAIEQGVGIRPTTFVYPFGAVSKETPEIVKKLGFKATLSCEEKVSRVTRDPESLYYLGRFLRVSGSSSKTFFEKTMKLEP